MPWVFLAFLILAVWLLPNVLPDGRKTRLSPRLEFFGSLRDPLRPEGLEQLRYLVALLLTLVLAQWAGRAVSRGSSGFPQQALAWTGRSVVGALVVGSWIHQLRQDHPYFSGPQLVVAVLLAGAGIALWRKRPSLSPPSGTFQGRLASMTVWIAALAVTAICLLPSIFTDENLTSAQQLVRFHISFTTDEFHAVLDGRTPLVDFVPQYAAVLPYITAPFLALLGPATGVDSGMMVFLTAVGLIAVFATLVTVTRDRLMALLLYVPFLLAAFKPILREGPQIYSMGNYFAIMPIRYLGPLVVLFLCSRYLSHPSRVGLVVVFLAAWLSVLNGLEFGVPTLAAVLVALYAGSAKGPAHPTVAESLRAGLIGGALALGAVVAVALIRTGSFPDLGNLLYFSRQFAGNGFGMIPMPVLGLHVVIFLTFASALVVGVALRRVPEGVLGRLERGLLAYSGLFGLGALSYYVGRSHWHNLVGVFPAWGLCLGLLAWSVYRCASRSPRVTTRPFGAFLVVAHFLLLFTLVGQLPSAPAQIQRIAASTGVDASRQNRTALVMQHTVPGETINAITPDPHRLGREASVNNIFPFNDSRSVVTEDQLDTLLGGLRSTGWPTVFVEEAYPEVVLALYVTGYRVIDRLSDPPISVWSRAPA